MFKSRDAQAAENKMVRDAANEFGLDKDQAEMLHVAASAESQAVGSSISYNDIPQRATIIKNGK
jgi:hypothetical protein